ncbi:MAG: hypothetical protein QOD99_2661 [Chthoniobacter sp.]|nr:hypothetical protein [Chthoniobacter sp.]
MHAIDLSILSHLPWMAGQSWKLDYAIYCLSNNDLLKGGLFMVMVWAFWFRPEPKRDRATILAMLAGAMMALLIGKALERLAPYSQRPYQSGIPGLVFPFDMGMHHHESSFPSDHATLFFAFCAGLFFLSRPAGWAASVYTTIVIALPRLYLGLHYPSDLIGGAVLGIFCVLVFRPLRNFIAHVPLRVCEESPQSFYPVFFLFTFLIATLFDNFRSLCDLGHTLIRL